MISLTQRTWFWPAIALLASALVFGGLFHLLLTLAPILAVLGVLIVSIWTFLGTQNQTAFVGSKGMSGASSTKPSKTTRMKFGRTIEPQQVAEQLCEGPRIGMPPWLARHVALTIRAFVVSEAPVKPWSLLLATDEAWCLDEFTRRFCKALGVPADRRPVTIECTSIMEFERDVIAKEVADSGLPLLIINATERLRRHVRAEIFTSPLEVVLQGCDPQLRSIVILVLEKTRPAAPRAQVDLAGELREHRDVVVPMTALPADEIGISCVLAPTHARDDRLTILWEGFCRYASTEFAVAITNESSPDDTMWDFLGAALLEWEQHGMAEAQKLVRLSSEPALARARVAGVKAARAVWEPSSEHILLEKS